MSSPNFISNSKNIQRVRELIEEGYRVESFTISVEKEVMTMTTVLRKSNDSQTITTNDDPDFLEFMNHFKRMVDDYDNPFLVYVDNLADFEKKRKNQPMRVDPKEFLVTA